MNKQFEDLLEGQKKVFDFWTNFARQGSNSLATNGSSHSMSDLMDEYLARQKQFYEQTLKNTDPKEALEKAPQQFEKWMKIQTEFAEKWNKFFQNNTTKAPWLTGDYAPENATKYWKDSYDAWQKWTDEGNQWMKKELLDKIPSTMQPHFRNFEEMYADFYKFWEALAKMMEFGVTGKEMLDKFFSPKDYQDFVNKFMGFKPVGNVEEALENANKFFSRYIEYVSQWTPNSSTISENWKQALAKWGTNDLGGLFNAMTEMNENLQDAIAPYLNVAGKGKEVEMIRLAREMQFGYVAFLVKSAELQAKVYEAGQYVLPDVLKNFYDEYQKTKQLPDYQSFFKKYINELEREIEEVLKSDVYSKMQNEVAKAGVGLKANAEKLAELSLGHLPFITKSEGDDIATETAALRKKIRTLEERLTALETGNADKKKVNNPATPKAAAGKKEDPQAALLKTIGAVAGRKDDLKLIKGIGPKLENLLNSLGIFTFQQISKLTEKEYDLLDTLLDGFQGRAKRDNWVAQAGELLQKPILN